MKKVALFLFGLLVAGGLFAEPIKGLVINIDSQIPQTSTKTATSQAFSIRLSSTAFMQNCLTGFTYQADQGFNTQHRFAIIDGNLQGGTTIYEVSFSTSTFFSQNIGTTEAICASMSNTLTLNSSTGTCTLSYRGYIRRNR